MSIAEPRPASTSLGLARSVSRNEFLAGLYILGCANGLFGRSLQSLRGDGWMHAITSIDINVVILFAAFAGVSLMWGKGQDRIQTTDVLVAIVFLGLVCLPVYPLSWLAVTGLSLYILMFVKGDADRNRGAIVLLALTVPMLWSRLIFQFFANFILDSDASLVAMLLGTHQSGNMVRFADDSGYMIVLAPCSSLANMSLAFLCWISLTQWVRHRWSITDIMWSLITCASVIAVNVTRISLMGLSRPYYEVIHSPWGDLVTNTVMLALMLTFTVLGVRNEIFSRA